jgi:hypothetical protein
MTTFDPETQQFVQTNGTITPQTWAEMSGYTVLRDFINNAMGKSSKPFS